MARTKEDIIQELSQTVQGLEGAPLDVRRGAMLEALKDVRPAITNDGSNITLVAGEAQQGKHTLQGALSDISVGLIRRKDKATGEVTSVGALGGQAKEGDQDVVHTALREFTEELAELGTRVVLGQGAAGKQSGDALISEGKQQKREDLRAELGRGDQDATVEINVGDIKEGLTARDDSYIMNRWNGKRLKGIATIDAHCHTCQVAPEALDTLVAASEQVVQKAEAEGRPGEVGGFVKKPLFEALQAFDADRINANDPNLYRYPHEYMAAWAVAAEKLGKDPEAMVQLAGEVQQTAGHRIDFKKIADAMFTDLAGLDRQLGVQPGTFSEMQAACTAKQRRHHAQEEGVALAM